MLIWDDETTPTTGDEWAEGNKAETPTTPNYESKAETPGLVWDAAPAPVAPASDQQTGLVWDEPGDSGPTNRGADFYGPGAVWNEPPTYGQAPPRDEPAATISPTTPPNRSEDFYPEYGVMSGVRNPEQDYENYIESPRYDVDNAYRQAMWDDPSKGGPGVDWDTYSRQFDRGDWGQTPTGDIIREQYPEIAPYMGDIYSYARPWEDRAIAQGLAYLPPQTFSGTKGVKSTLFYPQLPDSAAGGDYNGFTIRATPVPGNLTHEMLHMADLGRRAFGGQAFSDTDEFGRLVNEMPQGRLDQYLAAWGPQYGARTRDLIDAEVLAEEGKNLAYRTGTYTPEMHNYLISRLYGIEPGRWWPAVSYLPGSEMDRRYRAFGDYERRFGEP
jgi:hypothetical protein